MIRHENTAFEIANPEDATDRSVVDYGIPSVPTFESEYVSAKAFLQKCSTVTGDNMYDHLSNCLNKILAERPENVVDFFEEYSRKIKQERFKPLTDHLRDIYISPTRLKSAENVMPLFPTLRISDDQEMALKKKTNMPELLIYLERAGIGLPRAEMFYIELSMKNLIRKEPIARIRFWGKIFGLKNNYLIVECLLQNIEDNKSEEQFVDNQDLEEPAPLNQVSDDVIREPSLANQVSDQEVKEVDDWPPFPPVPQATYTEPQEPPDEPSGVGVNKYIYYVCHQPGEDWIQLPDVTSKQIRVARQIVKIFTGDLDQEIITYPEFPGKEREYLRAQIARISASTQISPLNFYTFDLGEGSNDDFEENPNYSPIPIDDLLDKSMKFWVHHASFILQQGRTTWWHSTDSNEENEGDEEIRPEIGPGLLAPCSEDVFTDKIPPWTVYASSTNLEEPNTIAVVRANIWPGAFTFCTKGKLFQNIYFGNGLKTVIPNFSPIPLPPVAQEYPLGPEIIEITDPSGIEEKNG